MTARAHRWRVFAADRCDARKFFARCAAGATENNDDDDDNNNNDRRIEIFVRMLVCACARFRVRIVCASRIEWSRREDGVNGAKHNLLLVRSRETRAEKEK